MMPKPAVTEAMGPIHELAWEQRQRLIWSPILANGAATIALAGIVGNAPHPDTALAGLTIPIALFGLGMATGVAGALLTAKVTSNLSLMVSEIESVSELMDQYRSHATDELSTEARRATREADLLIAELKIVTAAAAAEEDHIRKKNLTLEAATKAAKAKALLKDAEGVLEKADRADKRLDAISDRIEQRFSKWEASEAHRRTTVRSQGVANALVTLSTLMCAAGFVALLVGHHMGWLWLEPANL